MHALKKTRAGRDALGTCPGSCVTSRSTTDLMAQEVGGAFHSLPQPNAAIHASSRGTAQETKNLGVRLLHSKEQKQGTTGPGQLQPGKLSPESQHGPQQAPRHPASPSSSHSGPSRTWCLQHESITYSELHDLGVLQLKTEQMTALFSYSLEAR